MRGFSTPLSPEGRAQLFSHPPKRFGGRIMSVIFKADRAALEELVPPPLELPKDPIAIVRVNELLNNHGHGNHWIEEEPEWVQYKEAVVCIPVVYQGVLGNYDPYLWVDNHACAAGGREIYGLPKKMGKMYLTRFFPSDPLAEGMKLTGTLEALSRRLITASVTLKREATPDELPRVECFYTLRVIPSPESEEPDIHQLQRFKLQNYKYTRLWRGEGSVSFGDSPNEELLPLKPTEVVSGFYMEVDWILPWAEVIWDYRTQGIPTRQAEPVLAAAGA
jgi:acetoacetate decarboxylase